MCIKRFNVLIDALIKYGINKKVEEAMNMYNEMIREIICVD